MTVSERSALRDVVTRVRLAQERHQALSAAEAGGTRRPGGPHCVYCGRLTDFAPACLEHDDLLALDPLAPTLARFADPQWTPDSRVRSREPGQPLPCLAFRYLANRDALRRKLA